MVSLKRLINTKIAYIKSKIPDSSNLATKALVDMVENIIPAISNLATKTALTNLSNSVPDISTSIKKSGYDTKIKKIETKYVSNTGLKLAQANIITEINFDAKIIEVKDNIKKNTKI